MHRLAGTSDPILGVAFSPGIGSTSRFCDLFERGTRRLPNQFDRRWAEEDRGVPSYSIIAMIDFDAAARNAGVGLRTKRFGAGKDNRFDDRPSRRPYRGDFGPAGRRASAADIR